MSIDMFIEPGKDPRTDPPGEASELVTLLGYLDWYRKTLELKCSGLDAEALARRSVEPSKMSLLGLVRHMSDVERGWFRWFMAGADAPDRFSSPEDRDGDWDGAKPDPAVVEEAWQAWREEVAFADQFVAAAPGLEITGQRDDTWRGKLSLRWVLNHMIEEYARHIGHADLIRERIDGAVGQLGPQARGSLHDRDRFRLAFMIAKGLQSAQTADPSRSWAGARGTRRVWLQRLMRQSASP